MKRGLLVLVILLLTLSTVSALELSHEIIEGEALPGGEVSYTVHLNNNDINTLDIVIKSVDLNWILDQENYGFDLAPGESRDVFVSFSPLPEDRIVPGNYGVNLFIDTQTTRLERILPAKVLSYDKVLKAEFSPAAVIDPRRGAILRLYAENKNKVLLDDMDLELSSDHFQFTKTFSLGKEENTVLEFPARLDPDTVRGDYTAHLKVMIDDHVLLDQDLSYTVQEYEDLKEVTTPQQGFLLGGEIISQTNEGNTPVSNTIIKQFI